MILFVGRIEPLKGIDTLLQAISSLPKKMALFNAVTNISSSSVEIHKSTQENGI